MKLYAYGRNDTTGDPISPGTIIVFAESRSDADDRARNIYGDDFSIYPLPEPMLEVDVASGLVIVASSYYGVDVELLS